MAKGTACRPRVHGYGLLCGHVFAIRLDIDKTDPIVIGLASYQCIANRLSIRATRRSSIVRTFDKYCVIVLELILWIFIEITLIFFSKLKLVLVKFVEIMLSSKGNFLCVLLNYQDTSGHSIANASNWYCWSTNIY